MTKLLIIAGATATGKSSIAIDLARKFNGEIISCDSMQIYCDLNIGTAKISAEESTAAKHHLINMCDIETKFTVGDYQKAAIDAINDITLQGKLPILAGGTGLYIDSIIYPFGLGDSQSDINVRLMLEEEYARLGADAMHARLQLIDPVDAAKIHPNNKIRLIRALEIYHLTGKSKTELSDGNKRMSYDILMLIPDVDRDELYSRINGRVDEMIASGLVNEVQNIINNHANAFKYQSMQAIGYKEFENFFNGITSLESTIELIKQNSRNYAKRQITWLKNKYPFAIWGDSSTFESIVQSRFNIIPK